MRLHRRYSHGAQYLSWTKHMHWNSSRARVDNQITFLFSARLPDLELHLTQLAPSHSHQRTVKSLKPPLRVLGYPKNTQTLYLLNLSTTKSEIPITGSTGSRPANHHGFCLLMIEPHVPLQTPGADCCQILIQRSITWGRESGPGITAEIVVSSA